MGSLTAVYKRHCGTHGRFLGLDSEGTKRVMVQQNRVTCAVTETVLLIKTKRFQFPPLKSHTKGRTYKYVSLFSDES